MNKLNFNQSVGFPFETNILDEMQKAYSIFNALGYISGNFSIISGCGIEGTTIADGIVFINGEVLKFKGGTVQTNVIIVETVQSLEFEDLNTHEVIYTRYATFGTATEQWPWANFKPSFSTKDIPAVLHLKEDKTVVDSLLKRIEALEAINIVNVPSGLIAIWGQAANLIPDGWTEYTPLSGRMAVGFDPTVSEFDVLGDFGGSTKKSLTISELPSISFIYSKIVAIGKSVLAYNAVGDAEGASYQDANTNSIGGSQSFSIMNPYRVVLYIQKS